MFIITTDKIDEGDSIGVIGPRGISREAAHILCQALDGKKPPGSVHFKMFDGDGEHYYSGYWLSDPGSEGVEFEPLECFGEPNAGCTTIKIRGDDGKYTVVEVVHHRPTRG